jgi:cyclase
MKRMMLIGSLIVAGVFSVATGGYQGPPQGAQDAKTVRLRTLRPGDILNVLLGGGGNTLALLRVDGAVLIDTKLPGWGAPILDAIGYATEAPVTTIIQTHAHADHVGGTVEFPTVTQIIAHENTKLNMEKLDAFKGPNARFLPNKTVTDKMTLFDGPDQIDLYYFGPGHTNGDLIVVFPQKQVAAFGDLFPSKAAPVIDTANGGSGVAFPETLARAVAQIKGVARVITGHESGVVAVRDPRVVAVDSSTPRTMTWSDVEEYAEFNRDFLAAVQVAIKEGKTAGEAAATLRLPDRYKDYDMQQAKANVDAIYNELKK